MNLIIEIFLEDQKIPVLHLPKRPQALLDRVVAKIYEVETKHVIRTLKNNIHKFPPEFYFQLSEKEFELVKQTHYFETLQHSHYLPYAFTYLGANMLANILRSDAALYKSLQIIRTFSMVENKKMEEQLKDVHNMVCILTQELYQNRQEIRELYKKIEKLENQCISHIPRQLPVSINNVLSDNEIGDVILDKEILEIKSAVTKKSKNRKEIVKIWNALKKRFQITRYTHLPRNQFKEALNWIDNFNID